MNRILLGSISAILVMWQSSCNAQNRVPIKVSDENGESIEAAKVSLFTYGKQDSKQPKGVTDNSGELILDVEKSMIAEITVTKDGYYDTSSIQIPKKYYMEDWKESENEKPFGVQLRKKKNPILMYAKSATNERGGPLRIPVESKVIGYDIQVGDWVKPHGRGIQGDLLFLFESEFESVMDFQRTLTITFPNEGDGLIPFEAPLHSGSALKSNYLAPEDGYQKKWEQLTSRRPGEPRYSDRKQTRNFYFRVRTKLNDEGKVESAHYGKIYGDFLQVVHYFNPTPNDRNVEFDVGRNLIKDLKRLDEVMEP